MVHCAQRKVCSLSRNDGDLFATTYAGCMPRVNYVQLYTESWYAAAAQPQAPQTPQNCTRAFSVLNVFSSECAFVVYMHWRMSLCIICIYYI